MSVVLLGMAASSSRPTSVTSSNNGSFSESSPQPGSLHIVELKGPESRLVRSHRNHLIVANEVHEAVSQCLNYLRSLDETGATLQTLQRNELGIEYDYRRGRGIVLIGHPERVALPGVTREQIDQTIRSYNAHLTRIQVLTYADLLDSAERALRFEAERPGHQPPQRRSTETRLGEG